MQKYLLPDSLMYKNNIYTIKSVYFLILQVKLVDLWFIHMWKLPFDLTFCDLIEELKLIFPDF